MNQDITKNLGGVGKRANHFIRYTVEGGERRRRFHAIKKRVDPGLNRLESTESNYMYVEYQDM